MQPVKSSTADVEIVYPTLELLDESVHYSTNDLKKEINKLKKELYVLRSKG